jgi:nucleotide-binding universal stress UspA family protein
MRLLIAYDGSVHAEGALSDLLRAGLPEEGEATVLSVADVWLPGEENIATMPVEAAPGDSPTLHAVGRQALGLARQLSRRGRDRVQAILPRWQVRAEARAESPAWAIITQADQMKSDLVVIGAEGRGALGRLLVGSVSLRVLTELRRNIRIGRRLKEGNTTRILVGVDGSPDSAETLRVVRERRWPAGSEIRVLTAANWRLQSAPVAMLRGLGVPVEVWAEDVAKDAAQKLSGAGCPVSTSVRSGDAKSQIVAEAESWGADCVFVGARGLSRSDRWLLGSVSSAVAMRAPCSVEIIHPAGDWRQEPTGAAIP